jgi:diguanylate cyclase (GGDEF)-like protein
MAKPRAPATHDHHVPRRRFAVLGAVLVSAILAADVVVIRMERAAAIDDFRTATTNLANGMAAQTGRAFAVIASVLRETQGALGAMDRDAGLRRGAIAALLEERRLRVSGVDALALVDAGGKVIAATTGWAQAGADLRGRDFFAEAARGGAAPPFIGAPVHDAAHDRWSSAMALRLEDAQGRFAGVVLADVSLTALEDFYHTAMPAHRTVTVARQDGTVLARYPARPGATGRVIPAQAPWRAAAAQGGGSYVAPGLFDAAPVVAVVRPVRGLRLVLETSIAEADALAGWERQRVWLWAGGAAASLLTLALLRAFALQIGRLALKNRQLDEARGQLDMAMTNMSQGLCFFDGAQRLIVCNRRYGEIYGLTDALMQPGVSLEAIIRHCCDQGGLADFTREEYLMSRAAIARARAPHHSVIQMADGRSLAIQQQPMPDGGWVATHEDITERRRAEEQINFLARHDALTGLPNRSLLRERIGQARVNAGRGAPFALLFLDLDRFKAVNDTLGHAVGDELLRAVTTRLLATVRDGDTVARLGGDEFVVLQTGIKSAEDTALLAERIIRDVGAPYTLGANEVVIGVSIGVDMALNDRVTADDLLKNADMALYISKGEGRGTYRFFEPEMNAAMQNRHALERDLRCAMTRGEFELYYQPIVDIVSGQANGFEALLRWNHPERGLVLPEDFVGVAEECGLIIPIGQWVIEQATKQAALWPARLHLCVNLSPVQFRAADLVDVVKDALAVSGLAPERLQLEITESVLLQSNERNVSVMHRLRGLGARVVMDDFGVGNSSLSYLRNFPFDGVKIDRSFIEDLTTDPDAVYFVRAVIALCRNLEITLTAEGVETAEQLAMLVAEGCTAFQGFLFSRPRPVSQLAALTGGARLVAQPEPAHLSS